MTEKEYKKTIADPLVTRFKGLIKTIFFRYFAARDKYTRLEHSYEKSNRKKEKLLAENKDFKNKNKDYILLHRMFGNKKIDELLEKAKTMQQSKQLDKNFGNNQYER